MYVLPDGAPVLHPLPAALVRTDEEIGAHQGEADVAHLRLHGGQCSAAAIASAARRHGGNGRSEEGALAPES